MKYPSTNIIYKGMVDKGLTVQIIDNKDQKWQIWKKDYENKTQDSEAFSALKNYQIGDTFGVTYGETPEQFVNDQGKTINFTRRTIYSIMPPVASPTGQSQTPSAAQSDTSRPNWDEIAVGKCQTNFLAAYIASGKSFEDAKLQFVQARKLAELVVYGTQQEELPVIQTAGDSDVSVEDIPF